jgi:hypothetical protein
MSPDLLGSLGGEVDEDLEDALQLSVILNRHS